MNIGDENTIYAVKAPQPWQDDEYWIPEIFEEIKKGRARFGWGSFEKSDLRLIKHRLDTIGWNELDEDEKKIWSQASFMLDVKPGDYFVYINMPEYGKCSVVKITGSYDFSDIWHSEQKDDCRHLLLCEYLGTFDRNDAIVHPYLARRLKLQGAHWKIYAPNEFFEMLTAMQSGGKGKTPIKRLEEEVNCRLSQIADEIYRNFPGKSLEDLLREIFGSLPNVLSVRKGPDVNGADLEIEFGTGLSIGGLERTEICAVQVKAYRGEIDYDGAIQDIRRAFDSNPNYTCGLIVSTGLELTEEFEKKLEELRQASSKDVGVLIGKDLAYFLIKHGLTDKDNG